LLSQFFKCKIIYTYNLLNTFYIYGQSLHHLVTFILHLSDI